MIPREKRMELISVHRVEKIVFKFPLNTAFRVYSVSSTEREFTRLFIFASPLNLPGRRFVNHNVKSVYKEFNAP